MNATLMFLYELADGALAMAIAFIFAIAALYVIAFFKGEPIAGNLALVVVGVLSGAFVNQKLHSPLSMIVGAFVK